MLNNFPTKNPIVKANYSGYTDVLAAMQDAKIFVCGDLIVDEYIEGKVSRLSPEAPVPVVHCKHRRQVLGGAGNVAANVAALGGAVTLCGRLGDDLGGAIYKHLTQESKIDLLAFVRADLPTTQKTRIIAGFQQIVRFDEEVIAPASPEEIAHLLNLFDDFIAQSGSRCLVISDYGKGFLSGDVTRLLIQKSREAGVPVITDPKSTDLQNYFGSTILKPNLTEAREIVRANGLSHECPTDFKSEVLFLARHVADNTMADHVVLSLSEEGLVLYSRETNEAKWFSTEALTVADVSGAGDTMIATLALGCAVNADVKDTVEIANAASGIVCGKLGTATVGLGELLIALDSTQFKGNTSHTKLLSLGVARQVSERLRREGKRIVFTNGCFDILHAGHVHSLIKARSFGDFLFVGLNSDSSVSLLKGPQRPIQSEKDRAAILQALTCVDGVVIFSENTPFELIMAIKPHVLVKGGDYKIEDIAGAKEVLAWGGKVELVNLIDGRSTSNIIQKSSSI